MSVDDELAELGRALREQVAERVEVDESLAATLARPAPGGWAPAPAARRRGGVLVAVAAVGMIALLGVGLWITSTRSNSERIVPADSIVSDPPEVPIESTVPRTTLGSQPSARGVVEFANDFSATSVFSVLPGSLSTVDGVSDGTNGRLMVFAADLNAIETANETPRSEDRAGADDWLSTTFGLDGSPEASPAVALFPPTFPPVEATPGTSVQRRAELGFDLIDAGAYATMSAPPAGYFAVYRGDQVELSDAFVEVDDGIVSLGTAPDGFRNVDEISAVRPFGQPVRATSERGVVALGSSTNDMRDWRELGERLIDVDGMSEVARQLDVVDLVDVSVVAMDFASSNDRASITEPFSAIAVGTVVDGEDRRSIVTYVFANEAAATAMREVIEDAWRTPSEATGEAAADSYMSLEVTATGRIVTVNALLAPAASTTNWMVLLARTETIFTHVSTPDPASIAPGLIIESRPATDAELDRLDDDGRGGLLDCPDDEGGAGTWDYGPIGPDDVTGRLSSDALRDAINETEGLLPSSGWTELLISESSSTFVQSIEQDDWQAIVTVGGDPDLGVWRHVEFFACVSA